MVPHATWPLQIRTQNTLVTLRTWPWSSPWVFGADSLTTGGLGDGARVRALGRQALLSQSRHGGSRGRWGQRRTGHRRGRLWLSHSNLWWQAECSNFWNGWSNLIYFQQSFSFAQFAHFNYLWQLPYENPVDLIQSYHWLGLHFKLWQITPDFQLIKRQQIVQQQTAL